MKTLYLDVFSGISGDMFLGALIDLGVDLHQLERELRKLKLEGYHLHSASGQRANIQGIKFDVHLEDDHHHHARDEHEHEDQHHHHHVHDEHRHKHEHAHSHEHEHGRNYAQIRQIISASSLSDWVKAKSLAVFHRIALAEGKIHGKPPEQVHFHEVGAVDSIVD